MAKRNPPAGPVEKQRAVNLAASGMSQTQVAVTIGRPRATVSQWLREAEVAGVQPGSADVEHVHEQKIVGLQDNIRSEEHTSELQSLMRISYAVFCLKKKKHITINQ